VTAQQAHVAQQLFGVVAHAYDRPELPEPEHEGADRE
jgi:hypothetical protein